MRPARFLLVVALAATGCGSRTQLLGDGSGGASPGMGGSSASCGASAAPMSVAWQAPLPIPSGSVGGPYAADAAGDTFFVSITPYGSENYSILALDACGRKLWETGGISMGTHTNVLPSVIVVGDRVIAQFVSVDALDIATGNHLWSVDLEALAGTSLRPADGDLGPLAAAQDGTVYTAFLTASGGTIVAIDPAGHPMPIASPQLACAITGLTLDGAGNVDVLCGPRVDSFTREGSPAFSSNFPCMTAGEGPLASSASDLYMEVASCFMSLDGVAGASLGGAINTAATTLGGLVVDGDGNVYTSQTFSSLSSFDSSGASRWTASLALPVAGSLLLAEGGALLAVEAPLSSPDGPLSIEVFDAATGALQRTAPVGMGGRGDYVLTPAGQLVFTAYDYIGTNPALATGFALGMTLDGNAWWPTALGGADQRNAARGQ